MIVANENDLLTKREQQDKKKKEFAEDIEYLKEVEGSKGRDYVKHVEDEVVSKERDERAMGMNYYANGSDIGYKIKIVAFFNTKIPKLDLPRGWEAEFIATKDRRVLWIEGRSFNTEEGVVLVLKGPRPQRNIYIRAMRLSYNPQIDFKNMETLLTQAENTVDSAMNILLSDKDERTKKEAITDGGIILPYGR